MTTRVLALMMAIGMCLPTGWAQRIKGSDTVLPLTQRAAEAYAKIHPSTRLTVSGGGSGVGISALKSGGADIAQASRRIKFAERQKLRAEGKITREVIVAYDALAVIVHPSNRVGRLTRQQLDGIFTGRIRNWKEVGGEDLRIVPYARETSSGTYEFFKEIVLNHKNYMNGIMSMPATGAVMQSVQQTRGAIGYVGLAYLNAKTKSLAISFDQGKTYAVPTLANAKSKAYPVVRPLYYYYLADQEQTVRPFVDYLLSDAGQQIVAELGFVPIR